MYRGETCEDCGFPVSFFVRSYWSADNDLWNDVIGTEENPCGEGVVLCPPCFTVRAREQGVHVHWQPVASPPAIPAHAIRTGGVARWVDERGITREASRQSE
jgi:hypothetical protein